ncbi:uncharacterized protein MYCFIDRAFT_145138 [Pseudocercospora fijiensis CIRAD86]|uniref:Zn(2)-C6 fungal-type domain-containing protein n=1 Tax=Pseudocercospora fijiensis (strain CIRAD86) TaxID=383855 RepID=M2ZGH0_PSEFD|nr:uncharacterized protein MYCFIDRAFT_145138 [Pseudocercospora fijiensis CIRAD86]EME78214.1 hypothetical protein MYCFIDRAFT_145138 [Pseudocercospora fijiensis CIRAD86]
MPIRRAACEPCRLSKVSCDHAKPVCGRCQDADRAESCQYRERPFKRRRTVPPDAEDHDELSFEPETPIPTSAPTPRAYPNSGYLGSTSHTAIFEHLTASSGDNTPAACNNNGDPPPEDFDCRVDASQIIQESTFIKKIPSVFQVSACVRMVNAWIATGTNIALAGSLVGPCTKAIDQLLHRDHLSAGNVSRMLFTSSCRPWIVTASTTFEQFCSQITGDETCWESLGLFFVAVTRAATDFDCFETMFSTREERRKLQRLALSYADHCLEVALSLDCMYDFLLLLQYENFIAHSMVDGDQSYNSWRRLGDVASSLFALGYHEQADLDPECPPFLQNLRRAAFARAYSADKNVSIFLGRPPRISQKYCQIERVIADLSVTAIGTVSTQQSVATLSLGQPFDYILETWWTASCATLKEQVLDLTKNFDSETKANKAQDISAKALTLWNSLPSPHRLESPLYLCNTRSPVERDFLVSARLNHLHILFLLEVTLLPRAYDPGIELVKISAKMLHVAAEAIVMKQHLANSGTGLVWKIAYYSLPAAGIICLSLLNRSIAMSEGETSISQVIQDLSVLVAHLESGVLIDHGEPNYALLSGATATVKGILGRVLSPFAKELHHTTHRPTAPADVLGAEDLDPWLASTAEQNALENFELDFWLHLSEHPELVGNGTAAV